MLKLRLAREYANINHEELCMNNINILTLLMQDDAIQRVLQRAITKDGVI